MFSIVPRFIPSPPVPAVRLPSKKSIFPDYSDAIDFMLKIELWSSEMEFNNIIYNKCHVRYDNILQPQSKQQVIDEMM